ncbi:hypothetical protein BCR44DRAFT_91867, partial [Catenaria anguillulae PL171]
MACPPDHAFFPCWTCFLQSNEARAKDLHTQISVNVTDSLHNVWDEYQSLLLVLSETDHEVIPNAGVVMANRLSAFQVKELTLRAGQIRKHLELCDICISDIPRRFPRTEMHAVALVFQVSFSIPFGDSRLRQPCEHHRQLICCQSPQELCSLLTAEHARLERVISLIQWTLETLAVAPTSTSATSASGGQLLQAAIEMASDMIAGTSVTTFSGSPGTIDSDLSNDKDAHERPPSTRPATTCSHYDDDIEWLERFVEETSDIEPRPTQGRLDPEPVVATTTPRDFTQVPMSAFGPATRPIMPASERSATQPATRPNPPPVPPPPTRRPTTHSSTVAANSSVVVLKSTRSVRRPLPHIVRKPTTPPPALPAMPGADE